MLSICNVIMLPLKVYYASIYFGKYLITVRLTVLAIYIIIRNNKPNYMSMLLAEIY